MPALTSYDYAIIRVVPYVERGEFVNAGVILFCRTQRYLAARIDLDTKRLLALAPHLDIEHIQANLATIPKICEGQGEIGRLDQPERFHWLVAPRSTIIQVSPVHTGLCTDPEAAIDHLLQAMVKLPTR